MSFQWLQKLHNIRLKFYSSNSGLDSNVSTALSNLSEKSPCAEVADLRQQGLSCQVPALQGCLGLLRSLHLLPQLQQPVLHLTSLRPQHSPPGLYEKHIA